MEEPSIIDFVKGQRDRKEGNPQKDNASESYLKGYGFQYEKEQRINALWT